MSLKESVSDPSWVQSPIATRYGLCYVECTTINKLEIVFSFAEL